MIIGYNFFNKGLHGNLFDTAIPTAEIDEVKIGAGLWDEIFVSVDTSIKSKKERPSGWQLKTIMHSKFTNSLEAGSLGASGHVVTKIQMYRRDLNAQGEWLLVGEFPYLPEFNVYSFLDRLCENEANYQYAIVPVADTILGEMTTSRETYIEYDGLYISDLHNNYKIEFDYKPSQVEYKKNFTEMQPLNSAYPIAVFGDQKYKAGNITFLPLSNEQVVTRGTKIDGKTERLTRKEIIDFLLSDTAKVIRNSTGEMIVVSTYNVSEQPREGNLEDLSDISFSYIEIGKLDYNTMSGGGLIGEASMSRYTFDEDGQVIWNNGE